MNNEALRIIPDTAEIDLEIDQAGLQEWAEERQAHRGSHIKQDRHTGRKWRSRQPLRFSGSVQKKRRLRSRAEAKTETWIPGFALYEKHRISKDYPSHRRHPRQAQIQSGIAEYLLDKEEQRQKDSQIAEIERIQRMPGHKVTVTDRYSGDEALMIFQESDNPIALGFGVDTKDLLHFRIAYENLTQEGAPTLGIRKPEADLPECEVAELLYNDGDYFYQPFSSWVKVPQQTAELELAGDVYATRQGIVAHSWADAEQVLSKLEYVSYDPGDL